MKKINMCEIKTFTKIMREFDINLTSIAGSPEEEVKKIGINNVREYLELLKEVSQTIDVSFRKIVKAFGINENLEIYVNKHESYSQETYQNQIDTLKMKLKRENAGRKRDIEKKGFQISNDDVMEKRKNGTSIKDIAKETGLSTATINRIIRKCR